MEILISCLEIAQILELNLLAVGSDGRMCDDGPQRTVGETCYETADLHIPHTYTAPGDRDCETCRLTQTDGIYLHLVSVYDVHLLEYVVDVPHLYRPVDGGSYHRVPVADDERFQSNDPPKVRIENLHQIPRFQTPHIKILPVNQSLTSYHALSTKLQYFNPYSAKRKLSFTA